jgi:hypothetical protein
VGVEGQAQIAPRLGELGHAGQGRGSLVDALEVEQRGQACVGKCEVVRRGLEQAIEDRHRFGVVAHLYVGAGQNVERRAVVGLELEHRLSFAYGFVAVATHQQRLGEQGPALDAVGRVLCGASQGPRGQSRLSVLKQRQAIHQVELRVARVRLDRRDQQLERLGGLAFADQLSSADGDIGGCVGTSEEPSEEQGQQGEANSRSGSPPSP